MLLFGSAVLFVRGKTAYSFLELLGACCLVLVVVAHICEGLDVLPWMNWGLEHSAGHYVDLSGAVFGFTLFPVGYLLRALRTARKN
jgi:succinate dehydrogenase/fumarate reductase cytochrome b subunit